MNKSLEDIRAYTSKVAKVKGWELNPDEAFTQSIEEGLLTNFRRYGCFVCPCRDSDGDRQKDRDILCPCKYSAADIEEFGQCYCGLFLAHGFTAEGKTVTAIPERRPE